MQFSIGEEITNVRYKENKINSIPAHKNKLIYCCQKRLPKLPNMKNKKQAQAANASRRSFIKNSLLATTGFFIIPRHVLGGKGFIAPSDKLLIAGIGAGGKGEDDINHFYKSGKAEIAVLCDVDDRQAVDSRKKFPNAKYYKDFREMLDKEGKSIDA